MTKEQENYIRENYLQKTIPELCRVVNKSTTTVSSFMKKEKLIKPYMKGHTGHPWRRRNKKLDSFGHRFLVY